VQQQQLKYILSHTIVFDFQAKSEYVMLFVKWSESLEDVGKQNIFYSLSKDFIPYQAYTIRHLGLVWF
jgi:hypothetical protein